jgi:dipeptidyl aminopeptidase/acylaminoacyl peptidase
LSKSHQIVIETEEAARKARQRPRLPMTIETMAQIRFPGDVQLSPDGKRVAFVVLEWVPDEQKQRGRIWKIETSGKGEAQPLTKGKRGDMSPRWSPDGSRIAYISNGNAEKDKPQLYIISADGGKAKLICPMPNGVGDLSWSPDGSRIAFISMEGEEPKSDPKVITPGRHHRLWTVRLDYDTPEPVTPDGVTVWEYAWSPDSHQLALYYSHAPDDTDWYRSQIGLVPAHGGVVRQVTQFAPRSRQASNIAWSPDGTYLTYASGRWSDPGRGSGDLYLLSLEDGSERNLTPGIQCSICWCRWLPDGLHLLYTADAGVTSQIGMLDVSDGTIVVLEDDFVMQGNQPMLSPISDLRCFVTTHACPQHLRDIWFGEVTSSDNVAQGIEWRRLTHLNPITEETLALAPSQRIRYESVDGWLIDALFTPPLPSTRKGDSDALPPLFVNVHGGPSGAWTDDAGMFYTQLLAANGYASVRINYRGSWGRGVAFADAVLGDMGGKEFQDLLKGVDYLVEQGLVDGERVAIGGWSNGGFLAAWAVSQTTRFKAAIMGAGIADWHNMHAQSSIADADVLLFNADPLEQPDAYRERSPITFANRVTTPTLILHGEVDPAVPVAQAYAFYRALCERNIPVELVVYPREGHGLSEKDHLNDGEKRLLRWLEKYV